MNTTSNKQEGKILQLPTNSMEAIIMLCGLFSFVSTWAGAYKVTKFFSGMSFLGIPEEAIHFCFSLFTAGLVFYIIYAVLLNNLQRTPIESSNVKPGTTYILAGTIVIALSFWLSVEGLTLGYKTFMLSENLAAYNNDVNAFNREVDKDVRNPLDTLIKKLKQKRSNLSDRNTELRAVNERIDILKDQLRYKHLEIEAYTPGTRNFRKTQRELTWMQTRMNNLIDQRRSLEHAGKLPEINTVTEKLSSYRFGKTSTDTLFSYFTRGESLVEIPGEGLKTDKVEELSEIQVQLNELQTGYNSFLSVLKKGLQNNENGSRGFVIIILFFALLGDIVPLLISLKNNNPNSLQGFFKEAVQWFHGMTDELAKVDFVRRVSKAAVGFLFSIDDNGVLAKIRDRYINPITRAAVLEPLTFTFNFLLAIVIVWGLIGFVLPDQYHQQIGHIFHNWTISILDLVEKASI